MKPFFSIYPSCKDTDGIIEKPVDTKPKPTYIKPEKKPYSCDKATNRTEECQAWVSPEEQVIYDAKVAAYERYKEIMNKNGTT